MKKLFFLLVLAPVLQAQDNTTDIAPKGIFGRWTEPTGSQLEVIPCGNDACMRIVGFGAKVPTTVDANNPDESLRSRSLCNLQIGTGFHLENDNHADEGHLYDPKSGKTYSGELTRDGDNLKLRGYMGSKLFGRTEIWKRPASDTPLCAR